MSSKRNGGTGSGDDARGGMGEWAREIMRPTRKEGARNAVDEIDVL